jgi:hypothetical protein
MESTEITLARNVTGILLAIAKEYGENRETKQFGRALAGELSLIHESLKSKSGGSDHRWGTKINSLFSILEWLCTVSEPYILFSLLYIYRGALCNKYFPPFYDLKRGKLLTIIPLFKLVCYLESRARKSGVAEPFVFEVL